MLDYSSGLENILTINRENFLESAKRCYGFQGIQLLIKN